MAPSPPWPHPRRRALQLAVSAGQHDSLLVLANDQTPTRRNSFPIFQSQGDYNTRGVKCISGVNALHATVIESLQPYPDRADAAITALSLVNAHCNADKHAAIHPTFGAFTKPEDAARSIRREPVTTEFRFEFDPVGFNKPLEDGMTVARITPIGVKPRPNETSALNSSPRPDSVW